MIAYLKTKGELYTLQLLYSIPSLSLSQVLVLVSHIKITSSFAAANVSLTRDDVCMIPARGKCEISTEAILIKQSDDIGAKTTVRSFTKKRQQGLQSKVHGPPISLFPSFQNHLLLANFTKVKTCSGIQCKKSHLIERSNVLNKCDLI